MVAVAQALVEDRLEALRKLGRRAARDAGGSASGSQPSPAAHQGELPEEGLLEGEGVGAGVVLLGITTHESAGCGDLRDGGDLVAGGVEEGGEALESPVGSGRVWARTCQWSRVAQALPGKRRRRSAGG